LWKNVAEGDALATAKDSLANNQKQVEKGCLIGMWMFMLR